MSNLTENLIKVKAWCATWHPGVDHGTVYLSQKVGYVPGSRHNLWPNSCGHVSRWGCDVWLWMLRDFGVSCSLLPVWNQLSWSRFDWHCEVAGLIYAGCNGRWRLRVRPNSEQSGGTAPSRLQISCGSLMLWYHPFAGHWPHPLPEHWQFISIDWHRTWYQEGHTNSVLTHPWNIHFICRTLFLSMGILSNPL